jgi:hypothetical protein
MRSVYIPLTRIATQTTVLILENIQNALSFPHCFRTELSGNKKPSREHRKGTFEGQVVAGTSLAIFLPFYNFLYFLLTSEPPEKLFAFFAKLTIINRTVEHCSILLRDSSEAYHCAKIISWQHSTII